MSIKIKDYGRPEPPEGEERLTTDEMTEQYTVHSFAAPFVVVTRKRDGARGTLEFTHYPRFYFGFRPETS